MFNCLHFLFHYWEIDRKEKKFREELRKALDEKDYERATILTEQHDIEGLINVV